MVLLLAAGCAQRAVRPVALTAATNLPLPARIWIRDFAVANAQIKEYQGILRQQPSNPDGVERQRELGRNTADTLTAHLADGLRQLGFTVGRIPRDGQGMEIGAQDLIVEGQFLRVDEGSPLRRLVIGFGAGASRLDAQVEIFQGRERQKLLEFSTLAASGKMPGTIATTGASAISSIPVGLGITGGSAISTGLDRNQAGVSQMAEASADQAVRYLSEFFARQGWIGASQVKKARIGY